MMKANKVLSVTEETIRKLGIDPKQCLKWVEESFRMKYEAQLPAKLSVHPRGNDFFTSMPCLLPARYGKFGIKVVHRLLGKVPSLGSEIMLYDSNEGHLLAIIDGDWITAMRTGAVAALTAKELKNKSGNTYSLIGLGNTARATALCLLADNEDKQITFKLKAYKGQEFSFIERFQTYPNVNFEIIEGIEDFIESSQVLISCITDALEPICEKNECYPKGMLLIPVHTRGFQNCDLFFDKVFADDTDHVKGFKYYSQFKSFHEMSQLLLGLCEGRTSITERILAYNIGLGLHDIYFANKIYELIAGEQLDFFIQKKEMEKFWI